MNTATFTVSWKSGDCDLELKRPDTSYVDESDSDVASHSKGSSYETYTIDNPTDGVWKMEITRNHASSLEYTAIVTSKSQTALTIYTNKEN